MLAVALNIDAQTTVKGVLQDSLTHEGEPYATVRIYPQSEVKAKGTPAAMALTDADGKFQTVVNKKGQFVAIATSVGKAAVSRPFAINGEKEIDLGTLLTTDEESVMKAVEVVATRPIVKMEADKVSYSVQDDVDSRSMTVLDMLRKVPLVTVDGQDNITVNGQSSFKIYVDGKPNMMLNNNASQILKAMPASMVANIEVITNPGAKYDAEGAGGILNLTMAKMGGAGGSAAQEINGYNGSVYATGGNRGGGVGGNISGQQKKLSYSANVAYQYVDNGEVAVDMDRIQTDGTTTTYSLKSKNTVPVYMGDIALGYDIDSENQINASFGLQKMDVENKGKPTTSISGPGFNTPAFTYDTKIKMGTTAINGSLDYTHFFDKEHKNSMVAIYQLNHSPGTRYNETIYPSSVQYQNLYTDGDNCTTEHIGQLDFVNTLSAHSKLNYGAKYTLRNNMSEYYNLDGSVKTPDTDYDHRDQIAAGYVESENSWETWSLKAGLRYEHTWVKMEDHLLNHDFTKNYGNLVPSATLSHTLGTGQNIGLTYNMRIARPGITYLNPYIDRSEPTSVAYGNKDLEVEKIHNIGLTYNVYTQKFVISSSLREAYTNGGIEQYSFYPTKDSEISTTSQLNTTFGNIVNRSMTSLNLFAQWSATKTTRVIINGAVTYNYLTSDQLDITNKGWSANCMFNVQQTLPKNWTISAIAMTNSKTYTLQGKNGGMNIGILSISKSLLKDRLSLSLTGITGLSKGGKIHLDQYSEGKDFTSNTRISVPLTRVQFTAQWTFGNTAKQFQKRKAAVETDYIEHKSATDNIGSTSNM